jgi:hypothetical protein
MDAFAASGPDVPIMFWPFVFVSAKNVWEIELEKRTKLGKLAT